MQTSKPLSLCLVMLLLFVAWLQVPAVAEAATFTVTRFGDPRPDGCRPKDCSLREAIIKANRNPGSTISLPAGTYTLKRKGADTSRTNPKIGDLDILAGTTIVGVGSGVTIIQAGSAKGAGIHRIFDVFSKTAVKISKLTLRFGTDTEGKSGGCAKNSGVLILEAVVITSCTSPVVGGAIANYGTLVLRDSTITNNWVKSSTRQVNGGGIANGSRANGAPATATIVRTSITNNQAFSTRPAIGYGGGFTNTGSMVIQDSIISGNRADSSAGGLSDPRHSNPDGSMMIERTTVSGNLASRDAGGVTNDGLMTVRNSSFLNNRAGFQCSGSDCKQAFVGGLLNTKDATTDIVNSTFSGNACVIAGGGILNSATSTSTGKVNIANSTIVNNTCGLGAGVDAGANWKTTLRNSIVANNVAGSAGGDCGGKLTSGGYNIVGLTRGCNLGGSTAGNVLGVDPLLKALQNNGGPTQTHSLLSNSPAFNGGDPSGCADSRGTLLTTDQRGYDRPAMGPCDIGAYERGT